MAGKGIDKNTVIGIAVIFVLIIGYSIFNKPSEAEIEVAKKRQDSLALIEKEQILAEAERILKEDSIKNLSAVTLAIDSSQFLIENSNIIDTAALNLADSTLLNDKYGYFADAGKGTQEFYILENNKVKLTISSKGGRLYSIELKEYKTYYGEPLILFDGDSTEFGISFFSQNRTIVSGDMYFTASDNEKEIIVDDKEKSLSMRLYAGENKYLEYVYTLKPDNYMAGFDINFVNLQDVISSNTNFLTFNWSIYVSQQEKGAKYENNYTSIFYKFYQDEVDYISEQKSGSEDLTTKVKWIAFKQQFFSSALIAHDYIANAKIEQVKFEEDQPYLKHFKADITIPYSSLENTNIPFDFYFGPNHFSTLKDYSKVNHNGEEVDLHLEKLVRLGWGILGWINRYMVIPVFNFLQDYIGSYGLIILILTIILKMLLLPLTFKSYMSTAKMRVLKPQIDEISKKFTKAQSMDKQKATMALYKKVGVSPMGGCLPMVVQMPILIALYRFFPASIELRQKSFLWAEDLSAYDSVIDLPFTVPFGYGDHVSLFTLLMTISTILYTWMNNKQTVQTQSMPGMKTMMYFMPIMFLFFFNNFASALSYYYLLANLITFTQMYLFRRFTNDEEILKKLETGKKKVPKKSKFMERIEQAQKQRGKR